LDDVTIKFRTLTPIWTGDVSGHATGKLQMSGIIGGMRHAFEMLVRKHGGHACDCTSGNSCRYEIDKNGKPIQICPVCAIFGCTGLARSFILSFDGRKVVTVPAVPYKDQTFKNRDHDCIQRYGDVYIGKWLAVGAGCRTSMKKLNVENADDYLKQNVKLVDFPDPTFLLVKINRNGTSADIFHLLLYLLMFMSKYTGLGAKIQQGWGQFEVLDSDNHPISQEEGNAIEELGCGELKRLIDKYSFSISTSVR
jgi:CRISPR type III-B/RAMP module RAMP protein Cmr1